MPTMYPKSNISHWHEKYFFEQMASRKTKYMDALNFLYEKPTATWLDFYLNPEKLDEKFVDAASTSELSVENLVIQLCDQAKLEETFLAKDVLEIDERDYHKAKCTKLWIIVLKVCAYLKWNLKLMLKHISVVNLKRLIEELCALTWNTNSLAYVLTATQNLNEISSALRFVAILTARWVLDSIVCSSFPQPPAKITVSNPAVQIDPSYVLNEAKNFCLVTVECVKDLAVQMLEHAINLPCTDYCALSSQCFDIPIEGHGEISLNWNALETAPIDIALLQLKYDLAVYYFYVANYEKATTYFKECSSLFEREISAISHWTFNLEDLRGYFQALDIPLPKSVLAKSCAEKAPTAVTSTLPKKDVVDVSKIMKLLKLKPYTAEYSILAKLDGTFVMLKSFDPGELKHMIFKNHFRVSVHYCVPQAVQSSIVRLANGSVQDLIALYICKANQIAQFSKTSNVSATFLQAAVQEFNKASNDIPFEIIHENLRLELTRWHDLLHKNTDVARMGQMTQEIAGEIKKYIGEHDRQNALLPSQEMALMASAFLLNTCDWDYIILTISKSFRSRFMDFAKFVAALIYNGSRHKDTNAIAKEFLEILLPLCYDPPPRQMLLTRQPFLLILSMIKEQTAISLLLSFFGNLFNFKQGGITEIFVENTAMWPGHHVDSSGINENFLKEVLDIILCNGLLVNPNNPSLLRTVADLKLYSEQYRSAMQCYMQCFASTTDFFTKSSSASTIIDDKMINNMIKCSAKLDFHTIEALLAQLSEKPNYRAAVKAMQEFVTIDGGDVWYPFIWDINLLENFISSSYPNNDSTLQARVDEAMRLIGQQELNCHNSIDILNSVEHRKKYEFLSALCAVFFD